jgi:hypothetical protein
VTIVYRQPAEPRQAQTFQQNDSEEEGIEKWMRGIKNLVEEIF